MIRRNWQNFLCVLVASTLIINWSTRAWGQQFEKECDESDVEKCSQPLMEGDLAPFSGQLLTPKLAIDLGQKAAEFDIRLKIELEHQDKLNKLDLKLEKEKHQIDQNACTEKVDLLTDQLKDAKVERWYQHPLFVAPVSVVLTALVFIGAIYAVDATGK